MTRRRPFPTVLLVAAFLALASVSCGRVPLPPVEVDDGSAADVTVDCQALSTQAAVPVGQFFRSHLACMTDSDCTFVDRPACTGGCWQAINVASVMQALVFAADACGDFDAMGCVARPASCVSATGPRAACEAGVCIVRNLPGS